MGNKPPGRWGWVDRSDDGEYEHPGHACDGHVFRKEGWSDDTMPQVLRMRCFKCGEQLGPQLADGVVYCCNICDPADGPSATPCDTRVCGACFDATLEEDPDGDDGLSLPDFSTPGEVHDGFAEIEHPGHPCEGHTFRREVWRSQTCVRCFGCGDKPGRGLGPWHRTAGMGGLRNNECAVFCCNVCFPPSGTLAWTDTRVCAECFADDGLEIPDITGQATRARRVIGKMVVKGAMMYLCGGLLDAVGVGAQLSAVHGEAVDGLSHVLGGSLGLDPSSDLVQRLAEHVVEKVVAKGVETVGGEEAAAFLEEWQGGPEAACLDILREESGTVNEIAKAVERLQALGAPEETLEDLIIDKMLEDTEEVLNEDE